MLGSPVVPAAAALWLALVLALVFVASMKREAEGGGKEPDDV